MNSAPPTQIGVSLLLSGDHQAAVVCREGDGQAHVLLLRPRHVTDDGQQADGMGVAGQAEAVDLEPAAERQAGRRRETSALWRTAVTSFRDYHRRGDARRHCRSHNSPPPIPPVDMESAVTPLTVASEGSNRQLQGGISYCSTQSQSYQLTCHCHC